MFIFVLAIRYVDMCIKGMYSEAHRFAHERHVNSSDEELIVYIMK